MSIRHSLLAILDQGDCYGYQLRVEFERRTGGTRPLNVGQVYATLDRLERDGLVSKLGADATGHVYYAITAAGRVEVAAWFGAASTANDLAELALKVALAQTLPSVDAAAVVARQHEAAATAVDSLRAEESSSDMSGLSVRLVSHARVAAAEAELRWLERAAVLVCDSQPFALEPEPPRRGRPIRAVPNNTPCCLMSIPPGRLIHCLS